MLNGDLHARKSYRPPLASGYVDVNLHLKRLSKIGDQAIHYGPLCLKPAIPVRFSRREIHRSHSQQRELSYRSLERLEAFPSVCNQPARNVGRIGNQHLDVEIRTYQSGKISRVLTAERNVSGCRVWRSERRKTTLRLTSETCHEQTLGFDVVSGRRNPATKVMTPSTTSAAPAVPA
jgi:hypothetical protein